MTEFNTEDKSLLAKTESLIQEKIIDISQGFPVKNAQELWNVFFKLFKQGVYRIPIIGVGSSVKDQQTVMFINPAGKMQHITLWEMINKPQNVLFTTSLETFSPDSNPREFKYFLRLKDILIDEKNDQLETVSIQLGVGTDISAFQPKHPVSKMFNPEGKKIIKNIFSIPGVEFGNF